MSDATEPTLRTEEMTLNMGPQHPSTHGVLRFVIRADGEVMREAMPDVGYLHRSIEKIAEKVGYHGFMPYTDRVDYVCAMFTNQGWGDGVREARRHRGAAARRVLPGDRSGVQPSRVASADGRPDGDGYRRDDAVSARVARARDDQRPDRGAVRRAPDLQLHAHRRRGVGSAAGMARESARLPRPSRSDARTSTTRSSPTTRFASSAWPTSHR